MKLKLEEYKDLYGDNYYGFYITKNEILKSYENDKFDCFEKIVHIIEMLTTRLCYHSGIFYKNNYEKDYLKFDNFISNIKKSNIKGVTIIATRDNLSIHFKKR